MFRRLMILVAASLFALPGAPVQAGMHIGIGLPVFCPWHHYYGPRVVIAPAPVYVVPALPVAYVQPAPAVVHVPVAPAVVPAYPPPAVAPR